MTQALATAGRLKDEASSRLRDLKKYDEQRADFPGEHLFVLAAGSLLLYAGMRSRSLIGSALMIAAGSALVGRAASGRGGVARVASMIDRHI